MKPVIKKQHRIIPRRQILAAAAFAALAAGIAVFFVFRETAPVVPSDVHTASEYVAELGKYTLDDIAAVTVTPPLGDPYTLIVRDGALTLEEDPSFPLRPSVTKLIADNICNVRAENTILDTSKHPVDLAAFGLDPCGCACTYRLKDDTVNTIRVGSQIVGGDIPYYYFMWNDDPRIFAGGTDMYDAFSYDRSLLHTVTQPVINRDLLDASAVSGNNTLTMEYTDLGWEITSPWTYPADPETADGYLDSLAGIRFSRYIGPVSECDMSETGLDEPVLTLVLTEAASILNVPDTEGNEHSFSVPERRIVFSFGKAYDEFNRYVEYDGTVFTSACYLTDFLFEMGPKDLCLACPANLEIYRLTSLSVVLPSGDAEYDIVFAEQVADNGALMTDENGNILYECTVLKDGKSNVTEAFLTWYNMCLRQIVPSGTVYSPHPPSGGEAAAFVLNGEDGKRTISFYADGAQYLMYVDGTCIYYVSSKIFESLFPLP